MTYTCALLTAFASHRAELIAVFGSDKAAAAWCDDGGLDDPAADDPDTLPVVFGFLQAVHAMAAREAPAFLGDTYRALCAAVDQR